MSNPFKHSVSLTIFAALLSVVNLLFYNIPFFNFVSEHTAQVGFSKIFLIVSLCIIMLAVNFILFYLLTYCLRYIGRILIALLLVLNATCVYFIHTYNVIIDASMLSNVFNTKYSEASGFFSPYLFITITLLGIIPAVYVLIQKVDYSTFKRFAINNSIALGITVLFALLNYNQFLWIGQYDTELGALLMPYSYTVNSVRLLAQHQQENKQEILLPDATINDNEKTAVILVIGESARQENFSLYGYERKTNPLLEEKTNLKAIPAQSCATYTTAGVKAILEYKPSNQLYEILPNYLYRAGVDVVWRSNNWGEPPVHIPEYITAQQLAKIYTDENPQYDQVLFRGLKERIEQSDKDKVFIVLHTTTSHGPLYNVYYPPQFQYFNPICTNVEEGRNSIDKLINTYDNTILYTDYLLANLIDTLQTIDSYNCAMIFISDHGESLGENNLYMHGMPMNIAPKEQYTIPLLVSLNRPFRELKPITQTVEQHVIFHSVLNLLNISSPIYNYDYDLFESEYD